ncbi:MAG: DNA-directed RNA polymerase subunit K [Nanoarchaeota archaeon]
MEIEKFTKYETARILGARALQISMNAPILIKISKEDLEKIRYDSIKIAEIELNSDILPISIKRPFPKKKEEKLKKPKEVKIEDNKIEEKEIIEEQEIAKEGEIMELASPEDETETDVAEESAGEE